jgi:hypothetical protein
MSDQEHHCPFLNRADRRCSAFFSIERLQHAFEHCFDAYRSCEVYRELLVERQARRSEAAAVGGARQNAPGQYLWTTACRSKRPQQSHATTRFVQVRLPSIATVDACAGADRYAKPAA